MLKIKNDFFLIFAFFKADIEYITRHKKIDNQCFEYEVKFVNRDDVITTDQLSSSTIDNYWKWFHNKSSKQFFGPLQKSYLMNDN